MLNLFQHLTVLLIFSVSLNPTFAISITKPIKISASIGENTVTIFGYTSPNSPVFLTSPRVYAKTYSDNTGFFNFDRTLLPKNPSDLCLSSTDPDNRLSPPVCIPPPPPKNYHTSVGPILLSPTLTLDQDTTKPYQTLIASGRTIPNSPVDIYLFQKDSRSPLLPKPAQAFSFPKISTISDSQGTFSLTLPTIYATSYRLFAAANFQGTPTPTSHSLNYQLPSLWYLFWLENQFFIIFTPIFVLSLSLFFYLLHLYLNPAPLSHTPHYWLTLYPKSLLIIPR
jgi:hypothetical protein